jgi:hypothetical protein
MFGPVVLARDQRPRERIRRAVVVQAFHLHEHRAAVAEYGLQPAPERVERAGERHCAFQSTVPDQRREPLDEAGARLTLANPAWKLTVFTPG